MGKKSKRASNVAVVKPQAGAVLNNRAVCRAVNELWERTQGSINDSIQTLWQDYDVINGLTKVIKEKQGPTTLPLADRREKMAEFEKWLAENNANYTEQVEITEYPESGFGLRAKKDMKAEEKVLVIPDRLMMNSLTARDGLLGKLIGADRILQMMHNVALSLHLLNERYAGDDSFWKPYIDVLPHEFTTPFYFTKAELLLLQGSPTLVKGLQQIRNVAKLFAHVHKLIRTYGDPTLPLYKVGFYFQDFVWAVSCVMSRQNEIPLGISQGTTLALIPLWDFANHTNGHMTTFFDVENRLCECFAPHNFKAGEEFKIFYGPRNNFDLFVHQGFVYQNNQSDYITIKLGLSSGEGSRTRAMKERLLTEVELPLPGQFKLLAFGEPFTNELRFFVRVFMATHDDLLKFFNESGAVVEPARLVVPWQRSDEKALNFLEKRCQLLLQAYKTTIEEDNAVLMGGAKPLSTCSLIAVKMRLSEKKILHNAALFARTLREHLLLQPAPELSQNGDSNQVAASQPSSDAGEATTCSQDQVHSPTDRVEVSNGGTTEDPGETVGLEGEGGEEVEEGEGRRERGGEEGGGEGGGEEGGGEGGGGDFKINGDLQQLNLGGGEEEKEREGATEKAGGDFELTTPVMGEGSEREEAVGDKVKGDADGGGGREGGEAVKTELERTNGNK